MLNYRRVPTPLKNHGVSSSVGMMTFHSQLFLVIFHSYVSLPEGTYPSEKWWLVSSSVGMMTFHCQLFLESRNPAMFQSPPTSLPYVNWRLPFEAPNASPSCSMFRIQGELVREASFSGRAWEMTKKNRQKRNHHLRWGWTRKKRHHCHLTGAKLNAGNFREWSISSLVMSSSYSPQQPIHSLLGGSSQLGSGL